VVTAAEMNTGLRDNLNFLHTFSGAQASKAAVQSIGTGALTVLVLDTESFDTDAFHDTVTNNSRMTIPTGFGGYYQIVASYGAASNATGWRQVGILLNAVTTLALSTISAFTGIACVQASVIAHLNAADYVEAQVWQSSGGALNTVVGTTFLELLRLGV
jgi:hypothetical protein